MNTENKEQNVEDNVCLGVRSTNFKTKHDQVVINGDSSEEYQEKFFQNIPPGYRFCPFDEELIVDYLKKKIFNKTLPSNRIVAVNLYHFNPQTLAEKYEKYGEKEKEWYFFTPRNRKYKNGSRPNRAAGDGYWKATGADKHIKYNNNEIIGYKNILVFYQGKPPQGTKTNWIMHEFRISDPPQVIKRDECDMKLDEWVLCRIYKKVETKYVRSNKRKKESIDQGSDQENMNINIMDAEDHMMPNNNNNIMFQECHLDYRQSNIIPINPNPPDDHQHLCQLNVPFMQESMDHGSTFIFPNDNGNNLTEYAVDKLDYFDGSLTTTDSIQDLPNEEIDFMISQFYPHSDSNNLEMYFN